MANEQSFAISTTKIKVKWREQYVSEGVNKVLSTIPNGIQRGYWMAPDSTPSDKHLRLLRNFPGTPGVDEDQLAVYTDYQNGHTNIVREPNDVTLDLSGFLTWPIPAPVSYYIFVKVAYTTGTDTTANYYVADEDPSDSGSSNYDRNAIVIGQLDFDTNDDSIDFDPDSPPPSMYMRRTTAEPASGFEPDLLPGDKRYGFLSSMLRSMIPELNQKWAMDNATPTPSNSNPFTTLVQMTDEWVKRIDPRSAPVDWEILWRSHDVQADSGVTDKTVTLYWGNRGLVLLIGAYLSGSDDVVTTSTAGTVNALHLGLVGDGELRLLTAYPAPSSVFSFTNGWFGSVNLFAGSGGDLDIDVGANFTQIVKLLGSSVELTNALKLMNDFARIEGGSPSGTDRHLLFQSSSPSTATRLYYSDGEFVIAFNCAWYNATGDWFCVDSSKPCRTIAIGDNGINFRVKNAHDANFYSRWFDNDWTVQTTWMGGTVTEDDVGGLTPGTYANYNCGFSEGELYEVFRVYRRSVTPIAVPTPYIGPDVIDSTSFDLRNKWKYGPSTIDDNRISATPSNGIKLNFYQTYAETWGFSCNLSVESGTTLSANDYWIYSGTVVAYS